MGGGWYGVTPAEVASRIGVDPGGWPHQPTSGRPARAARPELLARQATVPGWKRFLDQYRTYMQLILVAAAIVSLAIKEWSTGVMLLLITVLNAVVGLRQEGKAESAMNALKAMVRASARVRRDGTEAEIPAEEVVVGDVVLLAAGDDVPADGRVVQASSLQIDEAALTGKSVPRPRGSRFRPAPTSPPASRPTWRSCTRR